MHRPPMVRAFDSRTSSGENSVQVFLRSNFFNERSDSLSGGVVNIFLAVNATPATV
jgi:hypothetical protein